MSRASSPNRTVAGRFLGPAAWLVAGQIYAKLVSFASYFVMVRYLAPDDVGLVALCWLSIVIGDTFFDLGLSQAYVRDGRRGQREESTLFWAVVVLALIWMGLSLVAGPLLAGAFGVPAVAPAMAALSTSYAFKAIGNAQLSIQIVERRVAGITARDAVAATVGAAVGIALAMSDHGAWALIARLVCMPATSSLLAAATTRWRPTFEFDGAWLVAKLRFGLPLTTASNFHWLAVMQLEGYLVGHSLGLTALGLLQFAKKPTEVLSQLMTAIQRFHLLRELSSTEETPTAWRSALRREFAIYVGFGTVVAFAALGFALLVIGPVWGDTWAGAIPLVTIFALAAPFVTLQAVAASGLVARGALGALFRANLVGAIITCAGLWIGARQGLVPLAWAQSLAFVAAGVVTLFALRGRGPRGPSSRTDDAIGTGGKDGQDGTGSVDTVEASRALDGAAACQSGEESSTAAAPHTRT